MLILVLKPEGWRKPSPSGAEEGQGRVANGQMPISGELVK